MEKVGTVTGRMTFPKLEVQSLDRANRYETSISLKDVDYSDLEARVMAQAEYADLYRKQMSKIAEQSFRQGTAHFFKPFRRANHFQRAMDCASEMAICASKYKAPPERVVRPYMMAKELWAAAKSAGFAGIDLAAD